MATAMNVTIEEGILQEAINFALAKTNNTHIKLKEEQKKAVHQVVNGRDVIAVLPTGFGKSLIYHLLPYMFEYINSKRRNISAVWPGSIVIVISPLNALMGDQILILVLRHDDQEMKGVYNL
jgi:superfamily II DNA helicase RecQ